MCRLRVFFVFGFLAVAFTIGGTATGADILTNWTGGNGNWTDATWDNGNPAAGYRAFVSNGGTVTVNRRAACSAGSIWGLPAITLPRAAATW